MIPTAARRPGALQAWFPYAAGMFVSYSLRGVNATVAPALQTDLGLSATQLGLLSSAFALALAVTQIPLGLALDSAGPRRVQMALLMVAAAGALLFSLADGMPALLLGRFLVGLGTAGCLMAALKSAGGWWSAERQPLINGLSLSVGGLGGMSVTIPAILVLEHFGWRMIFDILAAIAVVSVVLVFALAPPDRPTRTRAGTLGEQVRGLSRVLTSRIFWCVMPLAMFIQGGAFMAFHSLWLGPWLRDMAGQNAAGIGRQLMVLNGAIIVGYLATGVLTSWTLRRGIHLRFTVAAFALVFVLVQAGMTFLDLPAGLLMAAFGLFGSAGALNFTLAAQGFDKTMSGRVTTATNLAVFLGVVVSQAAVGAVIDAVGALPDGHFSPLGYRIAMVGMIGLELSAIAWLLAGWRPLPPKPQREGCLT